MKTFRRVLGIKQTTREQQCQAKGLPLQVKNCIAGFDDGLPSPYLAVAPISDPANPAYRPESHANGRAEMCMATQDLDAGTCVGCYPGSGKQWNSSTPAPTGSFEDGYSIQLRDDRGFLIPKREDPNPLFRSNDFRTNVADPKGPQGRAPNMRYLEVWHASRPYAIFFTSRIVIKDEELIWDYGDGYWSNSQLTKFRLCPREEQDTRWDEFEGELAASLAMTRVQSLMATEISKVAVGGIIWTWLMTTGQEKLAAVWICIGASVYVATLVRKRGNPLNL